MTKKSGVPGVSPLIIGSTFRLNIYTNFEIQSIIILTQLDQTNNTNSLIGQPFCRTFDSLRVVAWYHPVALLLSETNDGGGIVGYVPQFFTWR